MLKTKAGLSAVLVFVFFVNWFETTKIESRLSSNYTSDSRKQLASLFQDLEGGWSFENEAINNEGISAIAFYGYSISYFFLFPLLGLFVGLVLAFRREISGYRMLVLSITFDYLWSLPFFLLFPVPERWAYPDSGAILLSDEWNYGLITAIRPISGLDNCFPSSHVSLVLILVFVSYLSGFRFRTVVSALAATVILSTYVLGIHWIPDLIAGLFVSILSVTLARRADLALLKHES